MLRRLFCRLTVKPLDTLVEGQGGGLLPEESLAFLGEALISAESAPVIVMLHNPPSQIGTQFMDATGLHTEIAPGNDTSRTQTEITVVASHIHGVQLARRPRRHNRPPDLQRSREGPASRGSFLISDLARRQRRD